MSSSIEGSFFGAAMGRALADVPRLADAVSVLANGSVIGAAQSLGRAIGGPAASIASAVSTASGVANALASGSGLAGVASAVLGASGLSQAGGVVGSAAAVASALFSGNIAGALMGGASLAGLVGGGPAALALGTAMNLASATKGLIPELPRFMQLAKPKPPESSACRTCSPAKKKCDVCGR
jgi:hypothetical protein